MPELTPRELADEVEFLVDDLPQRAPRALWNRMFGPTPEPAFSSNGCGPKLRGTWAGRMLSRLIPDGLHGWSFRLPCHWHDHAYTLGGTWRQRRRADWHLALNVVIAVASQGDACSAPRIFAIGLCYWIGVRVGGWMAWTYGAGVEPMSKAARGAATAAALPVAAVQLAAAVVEAKKESGS